MKKNYITYVVFDETTTIEFDEQQIYFNNELFQKNDVQTFCELLNIF